MIKVQFRLCVDSKDDGDGLWFEMDWVLPCPPMGIEQFGFCDCCSPYSVSKSNPIYYDVPNECFVAYIFLDWDHATSEEVREHFLKTGWHECEHEEEEEEEEDHATPSGVSLGE